MFIVRCELKTSSSQPLMIETNLFYFSGVAVWVNFAIHIYKYISRYGRYCTIDTLHWYDFQKLIYIEYMGDGILCCLGIACSNRIQYYYYLALLLTIVYIVQMNLIFSICTNCRSKNWRKFVLWALSPLNAMCVYCVLCIYV